MGSSWQSRLQAKNNILAQKLSDNTINITGYATDIIIMSEELNSVQDVTSLNVDSLGLYNVVFPNSFSEIPMRRFMHSSGIYTSADNAKEVEPFVCYAPISADIPQGSLLLKYYNNPQGATPWLLVLKVADLIGGFGGWSIIYQKLNLVYSDTVLNPQLLSWLQTFAIRRGLLGY